MSKELKALKRIENFMSQNAVHWKQDIAMIETALKNYEELTSKPVILYGRTHGHTQALIDTICKNYKKVKITNLEDEKKLKVFETIKEKLVVGYDESDDGSCLTLGARDYKGVLLIFYTTFDKEKVDLFKEVLIDG